MKKSKLSLPAKAKKIKMLVLDVDGVMTDGSIILDSHGNETKAFHVRDGHGIKLVQKAGVRVAIITGRSSEVVNIRAGELGITEVHQGAADKLPVYDSLVSKYGLRDEQVAYIGDDSVDLSILMRVGFAAAVADADPSIRPHVDLIAKSKGGRGAVREIINFILKNRGTKPVS